MSQAKLTDQQVREIRYLRHVEGWAYADLCRYYGLSKSNVHQVVVGRSYQHVVGETPPPIHRDDLTAAIGTVWLDRYGKLSPVRILGMAPHQRIVLEGLDSGRRRRINAYTFLRRYRRVSEH